MENKIKITGKELRAIMSEYEYNEDIMCDDSQKVRVAKMALSKLPESDRIIYTLYLDRQSSRAVGQILGVSHSTVLKQLQRIKQEILYQIMILNEDLED